MIGRLHRLAPWFIALVFLAVGLAMGASAAGSPGPSGIANAWAEWIVGNAIALVGGLIAWTQITLRNVRQRVQDAISSHNGEEQAHHAAARHNHEPMFKQLQGIERSLYEIGAKLNTLVTGQATTSEGLAEQDTRLSELEKGLGQLISEHAILHGQSFRRRPGDLPSFEPTDVRGKE